MTKGTKWAENENRLYYLYKKIKRHPSPYEFPILISCTLKINVKFQIREKVVQKCLNFFNVFYDHT